MGALWVARSTLFHNNYNTTTVFKSIEDRGPSGTISPRPVCRTGRHKNYVQDAGLYVLVEAGLSAAREYFSLIYWSRLAFRPPGGLLENSINTRGGAA